jgi:hypothetical protein
MKIRGIRNEVSDIYAVGTIKEVSLATGRFLIFLVLTRLVQDFLG